MNKQEDWVQGHHPLLLAYLGRRVSGMAEELAQEVWLRMTQAAPTLASESEHRRYMFTTARRVLVDYHRRRATRPLVVAEHESHLTSVASGTNPEAELAGEALAEVVEHTLSTLKPEVSQVFRWRMMTRLSFKEIATKQGVGLNTALGRMHQANKVLRTALIGAGHIVERGDER